MDDQFIGYPFNQQDCSELGTYHRLDNGHVQEQERKFQLRTYATGGEKIFGDIGIVLYDAISNMD
jgi:hypothetical protein